MEEKVMKDCKVLALCSQKGGVGKTTSCVNLAVGLAKAGKKVLVIDSGKHRTLWNGSFTCKYYEQGTCLKTIYRKNERRIRLYID